MRRTTRSQSRQTSAPPPAASTPLPTKYTTSPPPISFTLPPALTPHLTSLPRPSTTLLNTKRTKLLTSLPRLLRTTPSPLHPALSATLVFAQDQAGTAVCISPTGLLLTCSHCVADADDASSALDPRSAHWLIFATGRVVRAVCVAWDARRDLALLQVTHAQPGTGTGAADSSGRGAFAHVGIAPKGYALPVSTPLVCIGHPGSEDLEAEEPGRASGYDVLHVSGGVYWGMAEGQDVQDNSEIGALMHDCWTYWGHSGAPILEAGTGLLVGVHSSWDEETGMRRGVGGESVVGFLEG